MQKIFLFCLLALLPAAFSLTTENIHIIANVDSDGKAIVTENYALQFSSPFEFEQFKQDALDNSSSLLAWQVDYDFFYPHFGEVAGNKINTSSITFDESSRTITLEYQLTDRLARLLAEEQRTDFFIIDNKQFAAFNEAGTLAIPEHMSIEVNLPLNSEVDATRLPTKVKVEGNKITLQGLQSNSLSVQYRIFKPIAPRNNDIVNGISNVYLIAAFAIVLLVLVYIKREELEQGLEDYLVEHSDLSSKRVEDDLNIDLDK